MSELFRTILTQWHPKFVGYTKTHLWRRFLCPKFVHISTHLRFKKLERISELLLIMLAWFLSHNYWGCACVYRACRNVLTIYFGHNAQLALVIIATHSPKPRGLWLWRAIKTNCHFICFGPTLGLRRLSVVRIESASQLCLWPTLCKSIVKLMGVFPRLEFHSRSYSVIVWEIPCSDSLECSFKVPYFLKTFS